MLRMGPEGPSIGDRVRMLQSARDSSREVSQALDESLVADYVEVRAGVAEMAEELGKLKAFAEERMQSPLTIATFVNYVTTAGKRRAQVSIGGGNCAIPISADLDAVNLVGGDAVYVTAEQSLVVGRVDLRNPLGGEVVEIDHLCDDGRLILKAAGGQRVIVERSDALEDTLLSPGDQVRCARHAPLAIEKIEGLKRSKYEVNKVKDVPLSAVAGNEENLARMLGAIDVCFERELAALYGLEGQAILLYGPPGNGKTLLAEACAAEIKRRVGKACFIAVSAGEWLQGLVGATEAAIRETFAALRASAAAGYPSILFIDEIDAIAHVRNGSFAQHHSDQFLGSLLSELDGCQKRLGRNICVIGATNRLDMLDPGLTSRFARKLYQPRPGQRSARAIMAVHMPETYSYSPNGAHATTTRQEIIDVAIAKLYAPNADGGAVATLKMQDGRVRTVLASDLVSGRLLTQICENARQIAFERHRRTGAAGVQVADMELAVTEAVAGLGRMLQVYNVHNYLEDLGHDEVVVNVTPTVARVPNRRQYLVAA